jgi:hypothetical protein
LLGECLDSIAQTVDHEDCEIFVVDNSLGDPGLAELKHHHPKINFTENAENTGFAKANNQGAKLAQGRFLLFLNPDTKLTPGALRVLTDHLLTHTTTGIAAPKVLNADGSLQYSCRRFPTLWTALFNRYSLLTRLFPGNRFTRNYLLLDYDHQQPREVDWVSGCCMMIPKQVFFEIGMFDERFFLFNEDVDLCQSAKAKGYTVMYLPTAAIVHHISSSNKKLPSALIIRRHMGMSRYYRKHKAGSCIPPLVVDFFILLRCLSQILFNTLK